MAQPASEQLAAEAAAAASDGGTSQAARVMKELAGLAPQMKRSSLQASAAGATLRGLRACESMARDCVHLVLKSLEVQSDADLAADAMWVLHSLSQKCSITRQWMLEANGLAIVQRALGCFPGHKNLVLCSSWVVYSLCGLEGILALLSLGDDRLPDCVIAGVVWVVYELRGDPKTVLMRSAAEASSLIGLIVTNLRGRCHWEVQAACCRALDAIVQEEPELAPHVVGAGAAPLLVQALACAADQGSAGEDSVRACARLLAALASSGPEQRRAMQQNGTVQALARLSMRGKGGSAEEAAMHAVGRLAGIPAVVQAMQLSPTLPAVVRGGLEVLAELALEVAEPAEVRLLPDLLQGLLQLRQRMQDGSAPVRCLRKCFAAICGVVQALAPHTEPLQVGALDAALSELINALRIENSTDSEISEKAVETLGRLAMMKTSWREGFRQVGLCEVVAAQIRGMHGHRRLTKYCFWCLGAVSGLPFVLRELRVGLQSDEVVDAVFCTVIDILDNDVEGDWVLADAERCPEDDVPSILQLVADAMRIHPHETWLQSRGCHCIGLLLAIAPAGISPQVLTALLNAARRHSKNSSVVRDVCYAFRALVETSDGSGTGPSDNERHEAVLGALHREGVDIVAENALGAFTGAEHIELLEDALVVLAAVKGVDVALKVLLAADPGPVRTGGVKGLFEICRRQPALLRPAVGEAVRALEAMVESSPGDQALLQNAELLAGLCHACT